MVQLDLFKDRDDGRIVNVASVPQRSPFRYPGGKTWLVPTIRRWLFSLKAKPHEFVEPFAGGGIASLTVAFEDLAQIVTMVELDEQVASVWKTILNGDHEWLADRIISFNLTHESVQEELAIRRTSLRGQAFQTLLRNRVYHGGILAPGSGLIRYGENRKGIKSRWYPETLKKRILDISKVRDRIRFIEGDGIEVLQANAERTDIVFFIDPPYTAAGKKAGTRLYTHNEIDHEELFNIVEELHGDFLMTYDNASEIVEMAHEHSLDTQIIAMQNTHLTKMTELLIGRNLDWVRGLVALRRSPQPG